MKVKAKFTKKLLGAAPKVRPRNSRNSILEEKEKETRERERES